MPSSNILNNRFFRDAAVDFDCSRRGAGNSGGAAEPLTREYIAAAKKQKKGFGRLHQHQEGMKFSDRRSIPSESAEARK